MCILVAFATQPQPGILEAFEIHATLTTPTPPSRCEAAFQPPTRPTHLLYATRNSRCALRIALDKQVARVCIGRRDLSEERSGFPTANPPNSPLYATRNSRCVDKQVARVCIGRRDLSEEPCPSSGRALPRRPSDRNRVRTLRCFAVAGRPGHSLTAESSVTDLLVDAVSNGARPGPPVWLRATP